MNNKTQLMQSTIDLSVYTWGRQNVPVTNGLSGVNLTLQEFSNYYYGYVYASL
ncbi:MAG: hypothetical protein MI864_18495 [Pseudomonadales bacterium]|nr:hypothetical protein [Pseudomonadales bacterium]